MLRRVTDLCFLQMPVNAVQYRVTVRIFNNRKLITNLRFELPSCSKLSNNLPNYDASFISLSFYIFLIAFLFLKGYISKISAKLYISILLLFNIILDVLVWLCSCLIIPSGDVEVNPAPKIVPRNVCQFVTETSTAYWPMTIPNHVFLSLHIYRFTNLILFVSQKHILIQLFPLMMSIW